MLHTGHEDILTLGMRADEARRRVDPALRVRYQRVHVVELADLQPGIAVPEEASEIRLHATPATRRAALDAVQQLKAAAGARPVSAFSLAHLVARAHEGWGPLPDVLASLAEAGLADVAELPVDMLEDIGGHVRRLRAHRLAARRLTMARPGGDRFDALLDGVRRCQQDVGGVERFAPLARELSAEKPTTGYEDVRAVARARLAVAAGAGPPLAIEVDWTLYGPKLAQVALTFGADFLDAVPATSDPALGPRRETIEDVERNIRAAGFEPQEYRPGP